MVKPFVSRTDEDILIYLGDTVKVLDDKGRVGGYLVRFSDGKKKDLMGEWFTSKTYLGPKDGDGAEALFEHGFPVMPKDTKGLNADILKTLEKYADRTFQPLKTKRDAIGIFAETVLDIEDDYEKFILSRVKAGKIGWSSGAAGHRVVKNADGEITRWPIAEGSLTPRPAEPLNKAMTLKHYLKSLAEEDQPETEIKPSYLSKLLNQRVDDLTDKGRPRQAIIKQLARESLLDISVVESILSNETRAKGVHLKAFARVLGVTLELLQEADRGSAKTIKDIFEEALTEQTPSRWQLDSVYSGIISKLVAAAAASKLTGVDFDLEGKIEEAADGYLERLKDLTITQAQAYMESDCDEPFYLRAMTDPGVQDFVVAKHLDLEDHNALVVSAVRSIATRYRVNHEGRVKAGRVLSEKNRQRMKDMMDLVTAAMVDCQKLLDETQPMASDSEKRLALTTHLRQQWRLRKLGVATNAQTTGSSS